MTQQPSWHCIANLGDVNPLDYGGRFVMIDKRGIYTPELWVYVEESKSLYTIVLERCFDTGNYEVSDNRFHTKKPAWFGGHGDLLSVARSVGTTHYHLMRTLCSSDPLERASAYYDIALCHGIMNFDEQPIEFTIKEARYIIKRLLSQIAQASKWEDGFQLYPKKK